MTDGIRPFCKSCRQVTASRQSKEDDKRCTKGLEAQDRAPLRVAP